MKNLFQNLNLNKAMGISVIFHLFLVLLFYLVHTQMVMPSPEYAEISFMSSSSKTVPVSTRQQARPQPPKPVTKKQEPAPEPVAKEEKTQPINLPKFRNRLDEETEMIKRDYGKMDASSSAQKITPDNSVYDQRAQAIPDDNDRSYYPTPSTTENDAKPSLVERDGVKPGDSNQPFTIEGDAAKRTLVKKVIPQYPPGLQKEATVKIRVFVLPNGEIGQMLPVLKGDSVLEEITLKSLREWKFNPLPPGENKTVQGIVTFRYELR